MCKIRLPIIIITIICCQLIVCQDITFRFNDHPSDSVEGDNCTLENGVAGICKKISECPSRLLEVLKGKRTAYSTGRCGFDHLTEIVCCPPRRAELACFSQPRVIDILNGLATYKNEFPFMAALGYTTNEIGENASSITYRCGGTLISVEHVLTAAHCVSNIHDMVPVEVRLGNGNLNDNEGVHRIPITDKILHPQYRRSMYDYDVAILKLKFRVDFGPEILPICLQTELAAAMNITSHTDLVVTGWGSTSFESEKLSDQLMRTPGIRIVDNEVCNKSFPKLTHKLPHGITDNMICAADPNTTRRADACHGDSGGPLLLPGYPECRLIGITAFGSSCGSTTPGVYTAIYPFLDWIEEHVWPVPPSDA